MPAIRTQPDEFAKVNAIRAKHHPFYPVVAAFAAFPTAGSAFAFFTGK